MALDRSKQLGEQSIPRLLFAFSLPAIVGMLAQALYATIDRIFVGQRLDTLGIAGITVSFPFMLILLSFGMLFGFGGTALISIRLGEQRKDEAERVLGNVASLLVGTSLVVTALGLLFLDPLLVRFGASPEVLPYAHDYLQVLVLGATFQITSFGLNAAIRGEGNPRMAMLTLLIGVLLNIILAPLFIFVCDWGMRGAALATVCGQAVSTVWVVAYFLSGKSLLHLHPRNLRLRWPLCVAIVSIGAPPFLMQLAASVVNSLLNNQLRLYGGDLAISVMGVIYTLVMNIAMPIFGINQGVQPIIGYNYGARNFDRVRKALQTAILAASAIALGGFLVTVAFPTQVLRLFVRHNEALIELGTHAMRISLLMMPIVGFQVVGSNYFQAVGRPRRAILLMLSRQVLLLIPAMLILPRYLGLDGIWAAFPVADACSALLTGGCLWIELRSLRRREAEISAVRSGGEAQPR